MARSQQDYLQQIQFAQREDLQILLPALDIFSEEMRVLIQNIGNGRFPTCSIKVYNTQHVEIASSTLTGCVVQVTANSVFYAVLTTENKLNIYSTRSTQLIKAGLILDGVCMLFSNGEASLMCTITLKGVVSLFRVKDMQSLDSCVQIWTSSLADVLKLRSALLLQKKQSTAF